MGYITFDSEIVEKKAKSELKKLPEWESFFAKVGRRNFITPEGAQKVTKIRIYSSDFTNDDLDDLKYFVNLKLLDIRSFGLTDLQNAPLLEKLESLSISTGNHAIDLTDLKKFPNLKSLEMGDVKNLQSLSNLKKLRTIELYTSGISDISCLSELHFITRLVLGGNEIEDLSPFASLKKLKELRLNGNRISDLTPLRGLKNIKTLSLCYNQIHDISPLSELVSLEKIYFGENKIQNISALSNCENLRVIEIFGNPLLSIEPLLCLKHLESIATDTGEIYEPLSSKFEKRAGIRTNGNVCGVHEEYEYWGFTKKSDI